MAYFSNSTDGDILDQQCGDCPLGCGWKSSASQDPLAFLDEPVPLAQDPLPCPVLFVQEQFNYDQIDKGQEKLREAMEMLVDKEGICQVRKLLAETRDPSGAER